MDFVLSQHGGFVGDVQQGVDPPEDPINAGGEYRGAVHPQRERIFPESVEEFVPLRLPEVPGCAPESLTVPGTNRRTSTSTTSEGDQTS